MFRSKVNAIIAFLRGGTSKFTSAERTLLQSVFKALPEHDAHIFLEQIEAVSLVQRHNPGRMVVAFYPRRSQVRPLPYMGYEYCIAKVRYTADGMKKWTYIVLHDGIFMSLERNVPLKNTDITNVNEVILRPDMYKPVSYDIDREEHE